MAQNANKKYVDEGLIDGEQAVDRRFHIDEILADPLHRLRFETKYEKGALDWEALKQRFESMISAQWGDQPEREQLFIRRLGEELEKAKLIWDAGALGEVKPNPSDRYTKLLWAVMLDKAEQHPQKNAFFEPLWRALASSPAMEAQRQNFAARMKDSGTLTFKGKTDVPVPLYTAPGSWFYNARKSENPHLLHSFVSLDIRESLRLGDFVDPLFHHENNHQLDSIFRPERVMKPAQEAKELRAQLGSISVTDETTSLDDPAKQALLEQYLVKQYEASLVHGIWNAAEDNMVDQGVVDLVQKTAHPYPYRIDIGNNIVEALITGAGKYALGQANANEVPKSANARLKALEWNITQAQFIRNGLTDDTPEGWAKVGVKLAEMESGEARYREMRALCDQIAHCKPHPDLQQMPTRYHAKAREKNTERNALIEKLIAEFIEPTLQEALEDFKRQDLPSKIQRLKDQLKALQEGHAIPGGGGVGQGIPLDIDLTNPPTPTPTPEPQEGKGDFDDLVKDAHTRPEHHDSGAGNTPPPPQQQPKILPNIGPLSGAGSNGIAGAGARAIAEINLTDGRTLEELRGDPLYDAAKSAIAEKLRAIADQFPTVITAMDPSHYTAKRPKHSELKKRLNIPRHIRKKAQHELGLQRYDGKVIRQDQEETIGSPGDLMLYIDFSGSMGSGPGSRLEAAVKSAALLYEAASVAGFGCYIAAWGNTTPTLYVTPEMSRENARAALDRLLRAALKGENISNLHGGTNVEGAVADMYANQVVARRDEIGKDLSAIRGPVHGLLISDAETGSNDLEHYAEAMKLSPAMTLDAVYTKGAKRLMHSLDAGAGELEDYRQPIHVDISEPSEMLPNLVHWASERQQQLLSHLRDNRDWHVTGASLQQDTQEALEQFCSTHGYALSAEEHLKSAEEQREKLYNISTSIPSAGAGYARAAG